MEERKEKVEENQLLTVKNTVLRFWYFWCDPGNSFHQYGDKYCLKERGRTKGECETGNCQHCAKYNGKV